MINGLPPSAPFGLIVNDDPTQLSLLSGLLSKSGLEPRGFHSAEAALEQVSSWAEAFPDDPAAIPALVVTDLYMPGLDGWRFCRLLRSAEYPAFNHVPILVISATFSGDDAAGIAADLGANCFLPAPVDGRLFLEQVQSLLRGERLRSSLRALIVEDTRTLSLMLKMVFANNGYQVDTAFSIGQAREVFRQIAYDVVVLDYLLPDGLGDTLLGWMLEERPDCVCIMMTTDSVPELALQWMKRGAAAYLRKPFEPAYLLELCSRARRERALLRVQDLLELRTRELRDAEEKYRQLFENMTEGVALHELFFDPEGRVVSHRVVNANPAYFRLTGPAPQQAPEEAALSNGSNGAISFLHEFQEVAHSGQPISFETYYPASRKYFRIAVLSPMSGFCATVWEDITRNKQIEKFLRLQRDLNLALSSCNDLGLALEKILEAALQLEPIDCGGIYLADKTGGLGLAVHRGLSPSFVESHLYFGADSPQAWLTRQREAHYGSSPGMISETGREINQQGLRCYAFIPVCRDQQLLAVMNLASHSRDSIPTDTRSALETIAQQVASTLLRLQSDAALRESRTNLQTLFQSIDDFLFVMDEAGNILHTNRVAQQRLGYAAEELTGRVLLHLHPEDRRGEVLRIFSDMQAGCCEFCTEPLQSRDGRLIPVETRVTAGVWAGKPALFGISRDIGERLQAEAERHRLESQNRQLQKTESLSRMAGSIAHHFNNQLQAISGYLEMAMLSVEPTQGGLADYLSEAMQAAHRAAEISSLMLTYLGQTVTKRQCRDIADICNEILPTFRASLPPGVRLQTDFPSPGPLVLANAGQIQQALSNLFRNAVDSCHPSSDSIQWAIRTVTHTDIPERNRFPADALPQDSDYICITLQDTGIGIPPADLDQLFDPFFSRKFTGRGMGLPVVLGIVRSHEGMIAVESEPGRGSSFSIFLPPARESVQLRMARSDAPAPRSRPEMLLLVDDDDLVRETAAAMLNSFGVPSLEARDGTEALELFRNHTEKIGLVLCDISLPAMNGWDTMTALRHLDPDLPVILTSGSDEMQEMTARHSEKPQAFIQKPFQLDELRRVIRMVQSGKAASRAMQSPFH